MHTSMHTSMHIYPCRNACTHAHLVAMSAMSAPTASSPFMRSTRSALRPCMPQHDARCQYGCMQCHLSCMEAYPWPCTYSSPACMHACKEAQHAYRALSLLQYRCRASQLHAKRSTTLPAQRRPCTLQGDLYRTITQHHLRYSIHAGVHKRHRRRYNICGTACDAQMVVHV